MPVEKISKSQLDSVQEDLSLVTQLLEDIKLERQRLKEQAQRNKSITPSSILALKEEFLIMKNTALTRERKIRELLIEKESQINEYQKNLLDFYQYAQHIEVLNTKIKKMEVEAHKNNHPVKKVYSDMSSNQKSSKWTINEVMNWAADLEALKSVIYMSIVNIEKLLAKTQNTGIKHRQEEKELNTNIIGRWLVKMGWLFFSREKEEQYREKLNELQQVISQLRDELIHYKGTFEEMQTKLLEKELNEHDFRDSVKDLNDIYRQFIEVEKKHQTEKAELEDKIKLHKERELNSQRKIEQLESELHELRLKEDKINAAAEQKPVIKRDNNMERSKPLKKQQIKNKTINERNSDFERHVSLPIPPQSQTTMFNPFKYSNNSKK